MEIIRNTEHFVILRLSYGEELREQLENFCAENNIKAAWFTGIGATQKMEIGYANLKKRGYDSQHFTEHMEITSLVGNISQKDGKPFMHAHGTFAGHDMKLIGGHIMTCVISATCEIKFEKLAGALNRKHDESTGLHLLCAEST